MQVSNLEGLANLKCLYLQDNQIEKIEGYLLNILPALSSGARLLTLPTFHRLSFATNLAQLYLQNNSISVIENLPRNLIRLALDGNTISDRIEVGISDT